MGGARVEPVVDGRNFAAGGEVRGTVILRGGSLEQPVESLHLAGKTRTETITWTENGETVTVQTTVQAEGDAPVGASSIRILASSGVSGSDQAAAVTETLGYPYINRVLFV